MFDSSWFQVVGSLASKRPNDDDVVSGVLVKRNFSYHIMSPTDLPSTLRIISCYGSYDIMLQIVSRVTEHLMFYMNA